MQKTQALDCAAACILLVRAHRKCISAHWLSENNRGKGNLDLGLAICKLNKCHFKICSTIFSTSTYNYFQTPRGCLKSCLNYRTENYWSTNTKITVLSVCSLTFSLEWHENFLFSPETLYKCQLQSLQFYKTIKLAASNIQLAVPYIKQNQFHTIVFLITWNWLPLFLSLPKH